MKEKKEKKVQKVQKVQKETKEVKKWSNKKKIIFTVILLAILFVFSYIISSYQNMSRKIYINEDRYLEQKEPDYSNFTSSQCPNWQIMSNWEINDEIITVNNCKKLEKCPFWEKLVSICWMAFGKDWIIEICNSECGFKDWRTPIDHKPVIYLYPEEKTDVKVKLDYKWDLIADYPVYDYDIKWWDVIANPDSTIINKADNKEYSYLFWEWMPKEKIDWNLDKWFVVKWSESREFLQDILPKIWLTPKEYNEFIVFWYPIMQKNPYNLVSFSWKQYTDMAPLKTEPKYDSLLRVFMIVKPLEKPIKIEPQNFEKFERKGFTVVEWGGTVLE